MDMTGTLHIALQAAIGYLDRLDRQAVSTTADLSALRRIRLSSLWWTGREACPTSPSRGRRTL